MKKFFKSTLLNLFLSLLISFNVFAAGQLTQDATGIHYLKDDGTYAVSTWVEIANTWFFFDANGVCTNPAGAAAPDNTDGCYQILTSYTPFVTTDAVLLNQCLTNGTVVNVEGQYFITPEAATVMRNATLAAVPAPSTELGQPTNQAVIEQPEETTQPGEYVWITATGKKYHATNNCGNTNSSTARKVTREEAENRGLDACKICY